MKTSFYFVLWIGLYMLLFLTGNAQLINAGFFVVLAAVFGISYLLNQWLRPQIEYQMKRDSAQMLEIIYTNDFDRYVKMYRSIFLLDAASFIYMVVATAMIILYGDYVIAIIFGFFAYRNGVAVHRSYHIYSMVRESGRIILPDNEQFRNALAAYSSNRAYRTFAEMVPPPTTGDKALRVANFVFAILAIVLGAYFIIPNVLILVTQGTHALMQMGGVLDLSYGALAFIYGIHDLVSLIRGYGNL